MPCEQRYLDFYVFTVFLLQTGHMFSLVISHLGTSLPLSFLIWLSVDKEWSKLSCESIIPSLLVELPIHIIYELIT